nr:farnesoic acid carboxyl-O-methyltransferase-like [Coffea arabica]
MIKEAIVEKLDTKSLSSASNRLCIADLGCSVGPNTFFAVQNIIDAIENKHKSEYDGSHKLEFQVFFNDHASNDFNTLFTSLPLERQYFSAGVPGTFYDQLFPSSSIHFAHSSYSLHWLSKVPEKLLDQNSSWNKGKIHCAGASDEVVNAYAAQFEKDMGIFLNARAKEIVPEGMIVLIIPGIPDEVHPSELPAGILFNFLGSSLVDRANEGILNEAQIDSFNLPIYSASPKEMASLVKINGCFSIESMEGSRKARNCSLSSSLSEMQSCMICMLIASHTDFISVTDIQ